MSIFNVEDKIDYNWLIDNGFSARMSNRSDGHILTKILRSRNPFVYININFITLETVLHWVNIGKGTGITNNTRTLYMGVISDKIQMSSIMHKYSQENCLH